MRWNLTSRLRHDRRGATIIEFAIISPVMMLLMMGFGDLAYQVYAQSILSGAIQQAARASGIEAASASTIDDQVKTMVLRVAPAATFVSSRKSYDTFSKVKPEPFTDTNGNGVRNAGECFTDVNGNGAWDADPGRTGQGGASAVTLYTVTVTYPHIFPVARLFGWSASQTISATTLMKNQPYATQSLTVDTTVCT